MSRLRQGLFGAVALGVLLALAWWWLHRAPAFANGSASAAERKWPDLPRVVSVEVLNATDVAGLARIGTIELRAAGLDVKYFGGADGAQHSKPGTRVLIRSHDTTGLGRILDVLGRVPVEDAPAPNRFVDLTVILGEDYHALRRKP